MQYKVEDDYQIQQSYQDENNLEQKIQQLQTDLDERAKALNRISELLKDTDDYTVVEDEDFLIKEIKTNKSLMMSITLIIAQNTKTSPEALAKLSEHDDIEVVRRVADNTTTPPEILAKLSEHNDVWVVRWVASNPSTPSETLAKFSEYNDIYVVQRVAYNPNTPPEILAKLSESNNVYIVRSVAKNPNTPSETLTKLSEYNDIYVVQRIATNTSTPLATVAKTLNNTKKVNAKTNICICKNCGLQNEYAKPNMNDGSYLCYECNN